MAVLKHSFSEGELIAGNYRVLSIAGVGGMGVVYRALRSAARPDGCAEVSSRGTERKRARKRDDFCARHGRPLRSIIPT